MVILKKFHSVSDFVRNVKARMGELKRNREPMVLTVKGKGEAVVMSAETYLKLDEELFRATLLRDCSGSLLESFRVGQISAAQLKASLEPNPGALGIPAKVAFARLERKMKVRQRAKKRSKIAGGREETKTAMAISAAERGEVIPMKEAFAMVRKRVADRRKRQK